jgi:hypothetical protein
MGKKIIRSAHQNLFNLSLLVVKSYKLKATNITFRTPKKVNNTDSIKLAVTRKSF